MTRPSLLISGVLVIILIACLLSAGCSGGLPVSGECSNRISYGGNGLLTEDQQHVRVSTPEANKNCHAQMTLTYWYKDKALAESGKMPPIKYDFQTLNGWFPNPVSKQVTIYDDQGAGVKAWQATVDQADKNESGDYTVYSVLAFYPPGRRDFPKDGVEVDVKISYVPYKPAQK
ncbi:MAG: hypothetical protein A4E35_02257 [Methanoregula sp. PtaU1.Bin051]|nr:MAG: hypothetical protein A4E35_02257 [Methanoregula sp. PtaU1.Bin051]